MKAEIRCEVTCCYCGGVILVHYKNPASIKYLKEKTRDRVYSKEFGGNLCPECYAELLHKGEIKGR